MANLARYDPFGDLDDLFKGFMLRPVQFEQQVPQIRMDVRRTTVPMWSVPISRA